MRRKKHEDGDNYLMKKLIIFTDVRMMKSRMRGGWNV
jgi:hypothetical protein